MPVARITPATDQIAAINTYANVMKEIKVRLDAYRRAFRGDFVIADMIVEEFCYLQIRLICELIGLGCLIAHSDVKEIQTQQFQKEWSAARVIKFLSKVHPDFFPWPMKISSSPELGPDGQRQFEMTDLKSDHLTAERLVEIYNAAGDRLHRGSLRTFSSRTMADALDRTEFDLYAKRLTALLSIHVIKIAGRDEFYLTQMKAGEKGDVQVAIAQALPG